MPRRPWRWTRGATSPVSRRRCFSSRTHDPLTRYFAATSAVLHPGITVEERPLSQIHRRGTQSVLLHRCAQKYHDRPREYKAYLKSALESIKWLKLEPYMLENS